MTLDGEHLAAVKEIGQRYRLKCDHRVVLAWIANCLTTDYKLDALWYRQCLLTFVPQPSGEMFNIAVFCNKTNHFLCDRTIFIEPFLMKNFGVATLDELHNTVTCTEDDVLDLVTDLEKELIGHF